VHCRSARGRSERRLSGTPAAPANCRGTQLSSADDIGQIVRLKPQRSTAISSTRSVSRHMAWLNSSSRLPTRRNRVTRETSSSSARLHMNRPQRRAVAVGQIAAGSGSGWGRQVLRFVTADLPSRFVAEWCRSRSCTARFPPSGGRNSGRTVAARDVADNQPLIDRPAERPRRLAPAGARPNKIPLHA
jgi:hypothetical protein